MADVVAQAKKVWVEGVEKFNNKPDDSFDALRKGIQFVSKRCPEELDTVDDATKVKMLLMMLQKGKKPVLKNRVAETVEYLLGSQAWVSAVLADTKCDAEAKAFVSTLGDSLREKLEEKLKPPEVPLEEADKKRPLTDSDETSDVEGGPKPKKPKIARSLQISRDIMLKYKWKFPVNLLGTEMDEASTGFTYFFDATTKLTTTNNKKTLESYDIDFHTAFGTYEAEFPQILNFLLSMYNCSSRKSYSARIKFTVIKLRDVSPAFAQAVKDLPGGLLPWDEPPEPTPEEVVEMEDAKEKRGRKPVCIWIDRKRESYSTSELNAYPQLKLIGIHDDPEADDYTPREAWLQTVIDHAEDEEARVCIIIVNKGHLQTIIDVQKYCEETKVQPPRFLVSTRKRTDPEMFSEYNIDAKSVVTDWDVATALALEQVKTEYSQLFEEEEADEAFNAGMDDFCA